MLYKGQEKDSAFLDVKALGCITCKVVSAKTVSKEEDSISQRHELVSVKHIYKEFDREKNPLKIHGHDRNSSINKYLTSEHSTVKNDSDNWHATKRHHKRFKLYHIWP